MQKFHRGLVFHKFGQLGRTSKCTDNVFHCLAPSFSSIGANELEIGSRDKANF